MPEDNKSLDLLGVRPISESLNTATRGVVDGLSAFLSRICLPAAEEFGLLLKDKVSSWRAKNAIAIVDKAQAKLNLKTNDKRHAHPRLVSAIIENGSWSDCDEIQDMWAGLLASSCTEIEDDESNLIFINLLAQITSSQAKLLNAFSEKAKINVSDGGWLGSELTPFSLHEVREIAAITDVHRLDRELDHMNALDLINGGFDPHGDNALIALRSLGIQMYVRCHGYVGSPIEYLGIDPKKANASDTKGDATD